jgi:predicted small lipoprotein YifL
MLRTFGILVSVLALAGGAVGLAGCGQKGALFLPTEPAAAGRATLPQSLNPLFAAPPVQAASPPTSNTTATTPAE